MSKKNKIEYKLEKLNDLYSIMFELQKNNTDESTQFVAKELCSNVFKNHERASVIVKNNLVHLMIDKKTLTEEKLAQLKTAIMIAKKFTSNRQNINFSDEEKSGGFGIKMILNFGFDILYKDNKEYFSVLAFAK